VKGARYSFLNKINFRPLVDQDPDTEYQVIEMKLVEKMTIKLFE
jgi:hypothetical protein